MRIKNIIRGCTPPHIKALVLAYKQRAIIKRLFSLSILNSGLSREGIPFVKLENGLVFYGYHPTMTQRHIYRLFINKELKEVLSEDAFGVALDILIRYIGPESENDHIKNGKYYDLNEGEVVVEAGAYTGYYAMRVAEIVGQSGHVIAIEPVEENLELLSKNIEENRFRNITIVPKAVWKEKTVKTLSRAEKQRASLIETIVEPNESIAVECETLDAILKDLNINQVDFVRIQTNGAEKEVLAGMTETLSRGPKLLIAAIYRRGKEQSYMKIVSILHRSGYSTIVRGGNVFAWKD